MGSDRGQITVRSRGAQSAEATCREEMKLRFQSSIALWNLRSFEVAFQSSLSFGLLILLNYRTRAKIRAGSFKTQAVSRRAFFRKISKNAYFRDMLIKKKTAKNFLTPRP